MMLPLSWKEYGLDAARTRSRIQYAAAYIIPTKPTGFQSTTKQ